MTGLGAVTPLGNTREEFWRALVAGQSGVAAITSFDPSELTTTIAAEVKDFDADALHTRQVALGMNPEGYNPFPYPPSFLIFTWPFGLMPLQVAYPLWTGLTSALFFFAASWMSAKSNMFTWMVRPRTVKRSSIYSRMTPLFHSFSSA